MQIANLLLLTGTFIPAAFKTYIQGMDYMQSPFNFLSLEGLPQMNKFYSFFDFEVDESFIEFGLDSGSALISNFTLLLTLAGLVCISFIYAVIRSLNQHKAVKSPKCIKVWQFFTQLFFFSLYIRVFITEDNHLLVTSLQEVYRSDVSSSARIISLIFAYGLSIIWFALPVYCILEFCSTRTSYNPDDYHRSKELFSGLKDTKAARIYPFIYTSRKLLFVVAIILFEAVPTTALMIFCVVLQFSYLATIVWMRCMEKVNHNLIETINESYLFFIIVLLTSLPDENNWNASLKTSLVTLLMSNTLVMLVITLSKFYVNS